MLKFSWNIIFLIYFSTVSSNTLNALKADEIEDEKDHDDMFLIRGGYRPEEHTLAKHIVSIRHGNPNKFEGDNHMCGGSLIFPNVVLTAAHCVLDREYNRLKNLKVVAGSPFLNDKLQSQKVYEVEKTLPHSSFSFSKALHDIALLFLSQEIEENGQTISLVPLMDTAPQIGWKCTTVGWGRIFPEGPRPNEVVYVNLSILEKSLCSKEYSSVPSILCLGDDDEMERGTWKGDSGGPLLCEGRLTGIVSFGFPNDNTPTYCTNVHFYTNWIMKHSEASKNLCNFFIILFMVFFMIFVS